MSSAGSLGQLEIGENLEIHLNNSEWNMEIVSYNCQHSAVQSPGSPHNTHRITELENQQLFTFVYRKNILNIKYFDNMNKINIKYNENILPNRTELHGTKQSQAKAPVFNW